MRDTARYALYYLPYQRSGRVTGLTLQANYLPINDTANATWRQACGLTDQVLADGSYKKKFAEATLVGRDARTPFHEFSSMELPAPQAVVTAFAAVKAASPLLTFPTTRQSQVVMHDDLPQVWLDQGPSKILNGTAVPGEMYALQVGIWAPYSSVQLNGTTGITWTDLKSSGGNGVIAADQITCFNAQGNDYRGTTVIINLYRNRRLTRPHIVMCVCDRSSIHSRR